MPKEDPKIDKSLIKKLNASKPIGIRAGFHRQSAEDIADKITMARDKQTAKGFSRQANDMSFQSTGGADRVPLLYMDPLFDPVIMMFPKDNVRELNRRLRHYYQYNPYIRNIIDLHSELPLSDFDLKCEDPAIEKYYNEFKQRKQVLETFIMMSKDYWLLGEGMMYGNWDEYNREFSSFNQYPPEDVEIKNTYLNEYIYLMKPNETIKKQMHSADPIDMKLNDVLEAEMPDFYNKMMSGQPYIFNNSRFMHLARRPNKYTPRGVSPVLSIVKDLMYEDKLRMLLMTFVDRHVFPIKIFKIGSEAKGWVPPPSKMKEFENLLLQACFPEDITEILTDSGFKKHWEITDTDKLATVNPTTGLMMYEKPSKKYVYDWSDDGAVHEDNGLEPEAVGATIESLRKLGKAIGLDSYEKIPQYVSSLKRPYIKAFIDSFLSERKVYYRSDISAKELRLRNIDMVDSLKQLFLTLGYKARVLHNEYQGVMAYNLQWVDYGTDLIHFKTESVDCVVTPNHRMLVKDYRNDGEWKAKEAYEVKTGDQFRTYVDGVEDNIEVPKTYRLGKYDIDMKDFVELIGYVVTEGGIDAKNRRTVITQSSSANQDICEKIKSCLDRSGISYRVHSRDFESTLKGKKYKNKLNDYVINDVDITNQLSLLLGVKTKEKHLPNIVKNLPKEYLQILFDAMIDGDGTIIKSNLGDYNRFYFYPSSDELAKDFQEICFKLGFNSSCRERFMKSPSSEKILRSLRINIVKRDGKKIKKNFEPVIYKKSQVTKEKYSGKVFCYDVGANHTLIVRQNGKILITMNSNDPDFNIVTHPFVNVDYVVGNDKIMDVTAHMDWVAKRYMVGLFVNDTVLHGELGTYAAQSVSLKVLMNKYMAFRESVSGLSIDKIFKPLAVARGFKKRKQADLDHNVRTTADEYDVPKVFWRRMNLLNSRDLMEMVSRLRENGEVPFKYVADIFDWDVEGIKNGFKEEEGTSLDKLWRDIRIKKSEDPNIASQILDGTKTEDLKIPKVKLETQEEKDGVMAEEPAALSNMKTDLLGGPMGGGGTPPPPPIPGAESLEAPGPSAEAEAGKKTGVNGLEEAVGGPTESKLPGEQGSAEAGGPPAL